MGLVKGEIFKKAYGKYRRRLYDWLINHEGFILSIQEELFMSFLMFYQYDRSSVSGEKVFATEKTENRGKESQPM